MQVILRHSSGLRTRLELLPHPLRNATPDSTVETWTTAVGGCDNGLMNNEDYRPNLEWKYAAAMPQTAGTTSSQGRGSLRKTIRRIRRGAPSSHQEAKRNFFNSCLHMTSIKFLPVCERPDARPSSLQPVSTVISNHGSDPGAKVIPKVFCSCTVGNLSASSTLSSGVKCTPSPEGFTRRVAHLATTLLWPTPMLLNNHWLAELPHEQREPARQARTEDRCRSWCDVLHHWRWRCDHGKGKRCIPLAD